MILLLVYVEVLSIVKESTTEMAFRMLFGLVLFHPLLKFEPAITNTALRMSAAIGDMLLESHPVDEVPSTRTAVEMVLAVLNMLAQCELVNKLPVAFAANYMHILLLITFLRLIAGTSIIPYIAAHRILILIRAQSMSVGVPRSVPEPPPTDF